MHSSCFMESDRVAVDRPGVGAIQNLYRALLLVMFLGKLFGVIGSGA